MKKIIRTGVFETNSSSTHTLTIASDVIEPSKLVVNQDGYIEISCREFGWDHLEFHNQLSKLSYVLTSLVFDHRSPTMSKCYEWLNEMIFEHTGHQLHYVPRTDAFWAHGYIDHQSWGELELSGNKAAFKKRAKLIIFGTDNYITTDNDNR